MKLEQLSFMPTETDDQFTRVLDVTDSTVIERVAWHPQRKVLRVWFKPHHSVFDYDGVWPSVFAKLACAYSVGKAFNEVVRDRFPATKVEERVTKTIPATKGPQAHG